MTNNSQLITAATGAAAALGAYFLLAHTKCTASLLKCPCSGKKKISEGTEVKLYYYKATGLANQIRLALAAANIDFTDEYPTGFPPSTEDKELWKKIGGNSTTNVPMLTIGDKVYTQSMAVMKVIGKKANLLPKGDDEYICDKLLADGKYLSYLSTYIPISKRRSFAKRISYSILTSIFGFNILKLKTFALLPTKAL